MDECIKALSPNCEATAWGSTIMASRSKKILCLALEKPRKTEVGKFNLKSYSELNIDIYRDPGKVSVHIYYARTHTNTSTILPSQRFKICCFAVATLSLIETYDDLPQQSLG